MTTKSNSVLAALHEVMSKVGYVQKKNRNEFHRYNYASEAALLEVLRPAMVEAGLLLIPSVTDHTEIDQFGNTSVVMEYTLAHKDGDVWPEKIVVRGCGNDRNSKGGVGDKGIYKAITGANKYLLFKLFQIETGDDPELKEDESAPPKNNVGRTGEPAAADTKAGDGTKAPDTPDLIPVPNLTDEGAKWRQWSEVFKRVIDDAPTLITLNDWVQANESPLKNLEHASVAAHRFLKDRINNRRGTYAQAPAEDPFS